MKLVKLSLVAALAAGSFSALNAVALEDAIKNVEVGGMMRYRYDSVNWKNADLNAAGLSGSQRHHFRAFVTPKISVGDGFTFVGQVMYNNDNNAGYGLGGVSTEGSNTNQYTITKQPIVLKQAYLQYDLPDAGLQLLLGKQSLGTIWTNDFTGTAAKVLVTPTEGLTIAAFAVDSFEGHSGDSDAANFANAGINFKKLRITPNTTLTEQDGSANFAPLNNRLYQYNMYGAAVLANFAGLDLQLWGNYWDKTATLYAANLNYKLDLGNKNNVGVKVTYLGNILQGNLKNIVIGTTDDADATVVKLSDIAANGNLVDGRLFANFAGLDAQVGGIFFGKKEKLTINTLEEVDTPAGLYIGREIFYSKGSWTVLSLGQNTFGYVGVGYTLPMDLRVGVQGVFGQNKVYNSLKDNRYEISADVSYKVSKNLSFLAYYSYLDINDKSSKDADDPTNSVSYFQAAAGDKTSKQTVRLQALYKF